jgi:hypothetical protein
MENKTPILSITDPNTDISTIIENNNMGVAITTNKLEDVVAKINYLMQLSQAEKQLMGEKGYQYLVDNYQVEHAYNIIMKHITK